MNMADYGSRRQMSVGGLSRVLVTALILVLLFFCALRMMATVLNVEFVKGELFRELVEIGRGGIGNVVPAQ